MPSLVDELDERLRSAAHRVAGDDVVLSERSVRPSKRADLQWNDAIAIARRSGAAPRDVAERIVAAAGIDDLADAEVAPQGFVNLTLRTEALSAAVAGLLDDPLGAATATAPVRYVIDYSAPNIAKELHVGHLRSTVIGDCLARMLRALGHEVVAQNHVGDWGTQFGMLIEALFEQGYDATTATALGIDELTRIYRAGQARFREDEAFAELARARVVLLQSGEPETLEMWRSTVETSEIQFQQIYDRMGVQLTPADIRGESFYNDLLDDVVDELTAKGLLVEDDGALCAFPEGFQNRDGDPLPLIVRKAGGGYGYAATDLAALRYRTADLGADRVLYVVDARQSQHFAMVFAVAVAAGWMAEGQAVHVPFGTILGADGRPFKTRDGDLVPLETLLDEAVTRAAELTSERSGVPVESVPAALREAIGLGALKYGDLSNDRTKDYLFDLDRMISLVGNTAPYLQYSRARLLSIRRKAPELWPAAASPLVFERDEERAVAVQLAMWPEVLGAAGASLQPHRVCTYLYDLAQLLARFYESCPVLTSEGAVRESRLTLCAAAEAVLRTGLDLLGIVSPDQM